DLGSANGTYLNGSRVERDETLKPGDRIRLGDTEIVFEAHERNTDRFIAVAESKASATIAIPVHDITVRPEAVDVARLQTLTLLAPDGKSFAKVEVRRQDKNDSSELTISHTLLADIVEEKKALAFMDVSVDDKLSRAQSIIMQGIHSILCAPLLIGNAVVGVLYVDYLFTQRSITEDDVRLVAQIGRFAAIKLETTRLREDAIQKRIMDEELKTASNIQRRLLPAAPSGIPGYTFV